MFKFAQNLGFRTRNTVLSKFNTQKLSFKQFGIQALLSGAFLLCTQYKYKQMKNNDIVQNFGGSEFSSQNNDIVLEEYSESAFKKAKQDNCDVVILIEPDRFREEFLGEMKEFLKKFREFQEIVKGRKIKFMQISFSSREELEKFQKKHECKIERDTLFLLQNQYLEPFYSFGSYDWFENKTYFFKYFKSLTKLNQENYDQFLGNLNTLSPENIVLVGYTNKEHKSYEQHNKKFGVITLLKEYSDNPNIHMMLVTDKKIAQDLGLEKEGDLYIFQKSSKLNYKKWDKELSGKKFKITKSASLDDSLFKILKDNSDAYNDNNIFGARSFEAEYSKYSIVLETNENKLAKQDKNKLIKLIGEFNRKLREIEKKENKKFEVQFVNLFRNNNQRKYTIYVRDDIKTMDRARAHQVSNKKEIEELNIDDKPHSYIYNYPDESPLDAENLFKWFEQVQEGKAAEFFKSTEEPYYRKYSRKLVSTSFKKHVIDNPRDQAVFFYSKQCHACRQYGSVYEELGLQNMINKEKIEFNRMNSDQNVLDCGENFPYTPVFQVYKNGSKDKPYVYRHDKFTPDLLKDFLSITTQFNLIHEQTFDNIYKNYSKMEFTETN